MSSVNARRTITWFLALAALLAGGCRDVGPSQSRSTVPIDRGYLTGAAAAALGPDNQFNLAAATSLNGERIISERQAKRLAMAFLRTFGPAFRSAWEADRGAPINLAQLSPAPRAYFAQSPYGKVPRDDVHPADRRRVGPYYLVTLLEGDNPAVQMAVSALATDFDIRRNGLLQSPLFTGMDFISEGIPPSGDLYSPLSPEEAVELVGKSTGALVQSVPELVLGDKDDSPLFARWRIDLDREVAADVGSNTPVARGRTIYVSPLRSKRFAVATSTGLMVQNVRMAKRDVSERSTEFEVGVPVINGRPAAFRIVNLSLPGTR